MIITSTVYWCAAAAVAASAPARPPRRVALLTTSRRSPIKNDASCFEALNDANNLEKFVLRKSSVSSSTSSTGLQRKGSSSSVGSERGRKRKLVEKEGSESSTKPPISAQLAGENVEEKPEQQEEEGEPLPAKKLKLVQPATVALSSPLRPAAETLVPPLATVALRSSPRKRRQEPLLDPPSGGNAGDDSNLTRGKEEDSDVERLNAASVSVEASDVSAVSEQRPSTDDQLERGASEGVNGESLPPKTPQIQASVMAAPDSWFVCLFVCS
jgi:hypothetical protein